MKMSKLFVETLRDFPADAEVVSHKMLVRAGFIRKLTNGVYTYLPLMWKVLKKVENIVREENSPEYFPIMSNPALQKADME